MLPASLPHDLRQLLENQTFTTDTIGQSGASVLLFADKVLKIRPESEETRKEAAMLDWLQGRLPVPRCLYHVVQDGTDYLLMSRVSGRMACDPGIMDDPDRLIPHLADALRQLWAVDCADCPVRQDLEIRLADAETRVAQGLVDVDNTMPGTFGPDGFRDPADLLAWLQQNRPTEDPVLSHGDFCLPNIFLDENGLCGLIDLGHAGTADRWQDIALCWRSLRDNYCGRYVTKVYTDFDPDRLFAALGLEPDRDKLRYYLLLDELF